MRESAAVITLAEELSRYLRLNPFACDTIEGISAWWLSTRDTNDADLFRALDWLKHGGIIESHDAADGRRRYRRADPVADIDAQMEQLKRADE